MKRTALLFAFLAACGFLHANVFITGFGWDDFTDAGSDPALTQTATTSQFVGSTLTGSILGLFTPVDLTGQTAVLALTATVTGDNPATDFQLQLWDGNEFYTYLGNWSEYGSDEETTVNLDAALDQPVDFDFTNVQGLQFLFDNVGEASIDLTLNTLTAVPEPATCAALLGLVALGCGLLRRRRC